MADGQDQTRSQPSHLRTILWLALFVAAAFAMRSVFNIDAGFDPDSQRNLFTGNDPYYHYNTVTHVIEKGFNLNFDPTFNYPEGNWNPNPPLWTWTSAPLAVLYEAVGVADPVGSAINTMVAVWGALAVIPVFMIASDLWGRKAGLWAGFFMAISAPHIQRSSWGYADHDAISMFFILLAVAFLVRGFRQMETATYISKWSSGASVTAGLRSAMRANQNTLIYAALAGVAITACAVTWKGYPYALAILAAAAVLQLVLDHLRNRDSTVTWLAYLITTSIAAVLPWLLYYNAIGQHFTSTVQPSLYVLAGVFLIGLILVPTRNLPSILVFPALIVGAVVGYLAFVTYVPSVAHAIFSGLGYFSQTKLYETIAEAQRPDIGDVAANLGFFTFLAAFWGLGHSLRRAYKGQAPFILISAWAAVSIYLMFAASRFIVNAAPVFCVLLGFVMVKVMALAKTGEIRKKFRSRHGQNIASRSLRSLAWRPVSIVLLVFLLFLLPNAWLGTDAAMGHDFKREHGLLEPSSADCERRTPGGCGVHWGGYGIDFELKGNGWLETMAYLATLDTNITPMEARPAFIAWWDYGHWATSIGKHPTVADPFQSHYEMSGRFLASDSEGEAMQWLSLLLLTGDWQGNQGKYSAPVQKLLNEKYPALLEINPGYWYDPQMKIVRGENFTEAQSVELYEDLVLATGKSVGYFGVDDRMGPFATSRSISVQSGGIIYAPVFLANKNPDDYVKSQLQTANQQVFTIKQYEPDPEGGFRKIGDGHEKYFLGEQEYVPFNNQLYVAGQTPIQDAGATGVDLANSQQYFEPTPLYANTMFARAFGGVAADQAAAGNGLSHWRVIWQTVNMLERTDGTFSPFRQTALLQYYHGIPVSGTVLDDVGAPMAGVNVAFEDGFGAHHGQAITNATGGYQLSAPFSQNNDLTLVAFAVDPATNQAKVLASDNATRYQFSQEQARIGAAVTGANLVVPRGDVAGRIYIENDKAPNPDASRFNANNDTELVGATITVPGKTATSIGPGGNYTLTGMQAGTHSLAITLAGYNDATATAIVPAGGVAAVDIALTPKPSTVTAKFLDYNGTAVPQLRIDVTGTSATTGFTDGAGLATIQLTEGQYSFDVNVTITPTDGTPAFTYKGHQDVTIPFGGQDMAVDISRT